MKFSHQVVFVALICLAKTGLAVDFCSGNAFNASFYRTLHADLASFTDAQLCTHWTDYGMIEGRTASTKISPTIYLQMNQDVFVSVNSTCLEYAGDTCTAHHVACRLAPVQLNCDRKLAVEHWLNYGYSEGRDTLYQADSRIFNANYYFENNPDLAVAGYTANSAFSHWLDYGIHDGRRASSQFDVAYYLSTYSDVKNYVQTTCASKLATSLNADSAECVNSLAMKHYLQYGISEGRNGAL